MNPYIVPDKDKTPKVGKLINFTVVHFSSNIGANEYTFFRFLRPYKKISKRKCLSIADKFEILNEVVKGVKKKILPQNIVFQQVLYQPF